MERIRVVHVLDNLNTGGTELNAVRSAERLDPSAFDVRFLCLQARGPLRERLDARGIPVREIGVRGLASVTALRRVFEVALLVRRDRIHVVHAHDPYANILASPAVRLAGTGAVIASQRWWQDVHPPKVRRANRLAYRLAHRVLANSPAVGAHVISEEGVPAHRVVVIPNFVDVAAFEPLSPARRASLRDRVGLREGDLAVGIVANLYPVKDHAMAIRATARLATDWPTLRLVLVGEGGEREHLLHQARAAGVADRVLMPGRILHEPGLPGIFDVAALSSREEGFPNAVVEAMAASRPVVATSVGGVPDAVVAGETGFLVGVGDDEAMAGALDRLLRDDALRGRMGAAGMARARALYHADVVIRSLTSLYRELASPWIR